MEAWITLFGNMPASSLIKVIGAMIAIIVAVSAVVVKLFHYFELWRKRKNKEDLNQKIIDSISNIEKNVGFIGEGIKTVLADNLNRKCRFYLDNGFIPEDEFEEFVKEHEAYNKLHGNSTIDAKYNKVIEQLKVKSIKVKAED